MDRMEGGGRLRLSDGDRAAAVARLGRHEAAGRLTADEVRERSAAVRVARTRADLDRVFADLPDVYPLRRAWRDRYWRAHAVVFALVTTATVTVWLITRDPDPLPRDYGGDYWWPLWLALAWATLLLVHLVTRLLRGPGSSAAPAPAPVAPADVDASRPGPPTGVGLDRLTPREREVLALIGQGHANRDIAAALYISERTARTHVSNILRKLDLTSRTQAAVLANRSGLVS
jgi:DNA-binding CsgD family transcriptional regulator